MRLLAAVLVGLWVGGCGGALTIEVEISHQVRCTFVRYRGTRSVTISEEAIPLEKCREALEAVLREWEHLR